MGTEGIYEDVIELESPAEKDIFTIKCQSSLLQDLSVEVGDIMPSESN